MPTRRERLELPDGDFVDLDWTLGTGQETQGSDSPLVCVFHGLAGSIASPYAAGIVAALQRHGMRAVFLHFRGCSGEPNRLARAYHSGDTADIGFLVETLVARGEKLLAAIGFSLGANALLKYAGESALKCRFRAVVAVSPPLVLAVGANTLRRGFARVYQNYLLGQLKQNAATKARQHPNCEVDWSQVQAARDFWQFDDAMTAPLHGFRDVHHYYAASSSRQFLAAIQVPTLIIHSRDDPFWTPAVLPTAQELAPSVTLELSERGGHVGFVQRDGSSWVDVRAPFWIREQVAAMCREVPHAAESAASMRETI